MWKMSTGRKVVVLSSETDKPMLKFYTEQLQSAYRRAVETMLHHSGEPEGLMEKIDDPSRR
ncbi:MAG: hypothetical protein QM757_28350 [Paludibaculum sp.]